MHNSKDDLRSIIEESKAKRVEDSSVRPTSSHESSTCAISSTRNQKTSGSSSTDLNVPTYDESWR
ncbi:hypothetical protein F2Q68_00016978 [Brassica cretica]|uniref:Uncharacterized protein n=1 Tax=Brassica cretica TaxID=69181 RepID=A0A8S9HIS4_BRACR|nr:hypothetical protein F2Q68_00016978 [Brassica cretica]